MTALPSDDQLRETIASLRASAKQLFAQASDLIEKAAKLEDALARQNQSQSHFSGNPPTGPEHDGNH
jgi:hypothetical protein